MSPVAAGPSPGYIPLYSGETTVPSQVAPFPRGSAVTGGSPGPTRLTVAQALGWGIAFLIVLFLIVLFFLYGRQVRPVLGTLPLEVWPTSLS